MSAREYLFAVQDATGREVCSAKLEVKKVSEVEAAIEPKVEGGHRVVIRHVGAEVAAGESDAPGEELAFLRWPAEKKLSTPVRHGVDTD